MGRNRFLTSGPTPREKVESAGRPPGLRPPKRRLIPFSAPCPGPKTVDRGTSTGRVGPNLFISPFYLSATIEYRSKEPVGRRRKEDTDTRLGRKPTLPDNRQDGGGLKEAALINPNRN